MAIKKIIVILVMFGVLLPSFSFGQNQLISPSETLEEAKEIGERVIKGAIESLPRILERIWKEKVLPIWQGMYNWAKKNLWDPYIWPFLKNIWQKIQAIFRKKVEKRKEIIEEEFEKEKEKLKKEVKEEIIPKTTQSLWEKFKELIK
ncbi:MAG: hypothetical protein COX89_01500 [Candidatus Nealsonbacteria bacterium CG_4_10_14_0_2_um_filter_37_10]|uniref:Uncharacterized protein n=3 Tax=Candidatus Nealsoniibacteriota TaxID=1817911 RepID=A0A2M7UZR2_9BACT|nr:MAG: hypothetical protein COU43_01755 [Candidatus Nealsonbacteria bacterium CG10_big_fil_rev_8_21_14_0_10_37_25]PIZ89449.1 MAG: hypothetical protein COX89_01500 [Candidatus Nealsonbacteria bacterium CG_4_10_14_0_2_um_filter_37_10]PJA84959.1 MAG: hypothetical protein CO145_00095 [Candidatus Nealsonbacteria bacterium CG_4_9_14_3_um_filter_37_13]